MLKSLDYNVIEEDKFSNYVTNNKDYLTEDDPDYSMLITNPPFKYKFPFLEKAFKSGKPFAMLLPITCTAIGSSLFETYPLSVFAFRRQIPFEHDGAISMFKDMAWFVENLFPKHGDYIQFSYIDNTTPDDVIVFSDDENDDMTVYEHGRIVV